MQFECDEQVDELCFIHFHQNPHAYNVRLLIAFAFDYLSLSISLTLSRCQSEIKFSKMDDEHDRVPWLGGGE